MKLPFGLDLKTVIVTLALVYFVVPWGMTFIGGMRKGNSKAE